MDYLMILKNRKPMVINLTIRINVESYRMQIRCFGKDEMSYNQ